MPLHRRPVASRHTTERLAWQRGQRSRALHKSIAQASISKFRTAKLLPRPAFPLQAAAAQPEAAIDPPRPHDPGFEFSGFRTFLTTLKAE